MAAKKDTAAPAAAPLPGRLVALFDGDKGGVGKSTAASVFGDYLLKQGVPLAVVDGDPRNPDVSRMFEGLVPVCNANLRQHEGWMELTDFMMLHADATIVVSLPAGIGEDLKKEAPRFGEVLQLLGRPLASFWVINRLPDSINLLNAAQSVLGPHLTHQFVIKNLFFGAADKFSRYDASQTRQRFEAAGGRTLTLSELHERVVDKLFADNDNIMPFSRAVRPVREADQTPHGLTPSENMELFSWLQENHRLFDGLRTQLGL